MSKRLAGMEDSTSTLRQQGWDTGSRRNKSIEQKVLGDLDVECLDVIVVLNDVFSWFSAYSRDGLLKIGTQSWHDRQERQEQQLEEPPTSCELQR